ncbi:MAG: potassium channel protein [Candidatus Firestonebacteria bacterium]
MDIKRQFFTLILVVISVFLFGTLGYELIEKWGFLDSIYMTTITLATIGYEETHPLSGAGRVFTIFLIIGGISVFSYGLLAITTMIAEGELQRLLRRGRMDKEITKLKEHYIVCGSGELGEHIISELSQTKRQFVAVDKEISNINKFEKKDLLYIVGDAADDKVLIEAGILKAKGIFCCLPFDKDNLFVVLTARELNKNIRIVTKCVEDLSEQKFKRAGADKTVSTNRIGGLRMASEMVRPAAASFLDVMLRDKKGVRFEEIQINENSKIAGKTIAESGIHHGTGASVVAIKSAGADFLYNPGGSTVIKKNDTLVVLGTVEQIKIMADLV